MALGALTANDRHVANFLGDAENPAHTAWNTNAEKLVANWRNPQQTLSAIRHSLRSLYHLIADQEQKEDPEALIDFFSLADEVRKSAGRKKKPPAPPVLPPREAAIRIKSRKGGFEIVAGPAAANWTFPRTIRVRVAYDMIGSDPFKKHHRFDFDFLKGDEIDIDAEDVDVEPHKPNVLKLSVTSPQFRFAAIGFDERRDIVVDARAAP